MCGSWPRSWRRPGGVGASAGRCPRSSWLGAESAFVNLGLKRVARRSRPPRCTSTTSRLRVPSDTSFPSGHLSGALMAVILSEDSPAAPLWTALRARHRHQPGPRRCASPERRGGGLGGECRARGPRPPEPAGGSGVRHRRLIGGLPALGARLVRTRSAQICSEIRRRGGSARGGTLRSTTPPTGRSSQRRSSPPHGRPRASSPGRPRRRTDLAHVLQCGGLHLLVRRGRGESARWCDVAAHGTDPVRVVVFRAREARAADPLHSSPGGTDGRQ